MIMNFNGLAAREMFLRLGRLGCAFLLASLLHLAALDSLAHAQEASPANPATPNKVELLLDLLEDKEVQDWLAQRTAEKPAATPAPTAAPTPVQAFSERLKAIQTHISGLVSAIPQIPGELYAAALKLRSETEGIGILAVFLLSAAFIASGLAVERLASWALARAEPLQAKANTASHPKLSRALARLLHSVVGVAAFGLGSLGTFAVFPWPEPLREILLTFLGAALATLIVNRTLRALLLPAAEPDGSPGRRIIPASDAAAMHYTKRLTFAVGWYGFGYSVVHMLLLLGMDREVVLVIAQFLGLGLLAIFIEMVWHRPAAASGDDPRRNRWSWLFTFAFAALWAVWVAGAMHLFWLIVVAMFLPIAVKLVRGTVYAAFSDEVGAASATDAPNVTAAAVERIVRAGLVVGGIFLLAKAWEIDFESISSTGDPLSLLMRKILIVLAIILAIDMGWQLVRTLIDHWLETSKDMGKPGTPEAIKKAKVRTLLPIVRNVVMVFLAVLAVLMTLSTLGVDIAPLIASAGVVGVAIGVGSQTLVKDIISGMFYLLDDAFRVGEYVVAGSYKGTVESFSLRSVRLRHHRGPVYTIPFGELGAVQNLSRDYVIDKIVLSLTYDTDLEKVRKLLKQIGKQLAEDPELAPAIIEPLKMQRVDAFGDYGISVVLKVKTLPGEQFQLRQKALPLIKKVFDENGVEFAYPTVKVAEGTDHKIAAVQQVVEKVKADAAQQPG
jgi:moderate conductance mechanosensitive channel